MNRREFISGLGAAVLPTVARGAGSAAPNILTIIVDQFRAPAWMNATQAEMLEQSICPNIMQRIRNRSTVMSNYYVAAVACTPSRAAMLTGLYSHQHHCYLTQTNYTEPDLRVEWPTIGHAVPQVNPAYAGNCWWFGKWHLTKHIGAADPLLPYGFRTRTYPSAQFRSPDGAGNEGATGGMWQGSYWGNDADIAGDFVGWLEEAPAGPWLATVSLQNPHDICKYPEAFPPLYPPEDSAGEPCFPPPVNPPQNYLYSAIPASWNQETLEQLSAKQLPLQVQFRNGADSSFGAVTSWIDYLNWYMWLSHLVDAQVGRILDALDAAGVAGTTAVVFTSDHGDLGGSHGLRGKGGSAYEESIKVPLFIRMPGQASVAVRSQLCSSVDLFGLVCDIATGGSGSWRSRYADLANRESIWRFMQSNGNAEQFRKLADGSAYVLHTTDEPMGGGRNHVVAVRSKKGKYCQYSTWQDGTVEPVGAVDREFYDYANKGNKGEKGNDYLAATGQTLTLLGQFQAALPGVVVGELRKPLVGVGADSLPLTIVQTKQKEDYLSYVG